MKAIGYCSCGKLWENPDTGLCATCGKLDRKIGRIKLPEDPKPIKKQSDEMSRMMARYGPMKKKFIHGRWCGVHGKPCIPVDIHHTRGRGLGFEDSQAEEQGIPRLLDTRYWMAVCREAHTQIETNPEWARENGYSESRLSIK